MTETLLRNFGMDAVYEQLSGVRMSYAVEADARQVLNPCSQDSELMSDAARLQGLTAWAAA